MILASIGRSVSDLKVHLVLVTKYRRKAFTSVMLGRLNVVMQELLEKWDCKLIEFNGVRVASRREDDHVHLLFQYHPDVELSKLVNNLKSVSSRKLRQEFAEHLESFYWKDVFWSGSYFVASCGGITVSTLRRYIEAQESPTEST
ncbi:MAG: IS200/IS605 family transposase [Nostoc sp. C3-bin3]|nr:IS200/IS605 family transposase [Nostoc sp. C3-bin3]